MSTEILRRNFDVRNITADLIDCDKNTRYMELCLSDYECDVELIILRIRDKKKGVETVFRQPVGRYRDPEVTLH